MNLRDELVSAVSAIGSSPKVLGGVAATTTSLGVASMAEFIHGALSSCALLAGICATLLLGRVHWAVYKNRMLENKLLRKQLIDIGLDPDKDTE